MKTIFRALSGCIPKSIRKAGSFPGLLRLSLAHLLSKANRKSLRFYSGRPSRSTSGKASQWLEYYTQNCRRLGLNPYKSVSENLSRNFKE